VVTSCLQSEVATAATARHTVHHLRPGEYTQIAEPRARLQTRVPPSPASRAGAGIPQVYNQSMKQFLLY
jgi:hypothetical protein